MPFWLKAYGSPKRLFFARPLAESTRIMSKRKGGGQAAAEGRPPPVIDLRPKAEEDAPRRTPPTPPPSSRRTVSAHEMGKAMAKRELSPTSSVGSGPKTPSTTSVSRSPTLIADVNRR